MFASISNTVMGFRGDALIVGICFFLAISGCIVISVTKLVADYFHKSRRDDMEATLKMEMIQRGMGVEEIERVLAARMECGKGGDAPASRRRETANR